MKRYDVEHHPDANRCIIRPDKNGEYAKVEDLRARLEKAKPSLKPPLPLRDESLAYEIGFNTLKKELLAELEDKDGEGK